ncbi:hypothetical protein RU87_GL001350 [Lactococcus plantarum]|uniref:Uncharacterized protein n=1 Tax=Pseudolactococcus plantarum TaxID=1365 RepID=A0A2A5S0C5_9LACT|nr:hypothetical protein RU87_GL001350 [Lactococcus plantarum]
MINQLVSYILDEYAVEPKKHINNDMFFIIFRFFNIFILNN